MERKIIETTHIIEWHKLILEAEEVLGYACDENVQHYLIITLDKFITDGSFASHVIAFEFLKGMHESGAANIEKLRNTGDRCLILSGLFPERAKNSNVSVRYFMSVGQLSYRIISDIHQLKYDPSLFLKLSKDFVKLTDLLSSMRKLFSTH